MFVSIDGFCTMQSDLKGTLPTSIQNMAAQSQPLGLLKLRKVLDELHGPGGSGPTVRPDFSSPLLSSQAGADTPALCPLYRV